MPDSELFERETPQMSLGAEGAAWGMSTQPLVDPQSGDAGYTPANALMSIDPQMANAGSSSSDSAASLFAGLYEPGEGSSPDAGGDGFDEARSVGNHGAGNLIHEAGLRAAYHQGERGIAAETSRRLAQNPSAVEEVARWAVQQRNALRAAIRQQGHPIVEAVAKMARGARDMPSYEQLRAIGKTDAGIVASAAQSNAGVNGLVKGLRVAGPLMMMADAGLAGYRIGHAPEGETGRVATHEISRIGGALAGGLAGAKGGAALGAAIGSIVPGAGTAIGAGLGGVIGGIGGAIVGGWATSKAADWSFGKLFGHRSAEQPA